MKFARRDDKLLIILSSREEMILAAGKGFRHSPSGLSLLWRLGRAVKRLHFASLPSHGEGETAQRPQTSQSAQLEV